MKPLGPQGKIVVVLVGLAVALGLAGLATLIWARLTVGPDTDAMSGMYAFGGLLVGGGTFGVLALGPLALAAYWLRPVGQFWLWLGRGAFFFAATGPLCIFAKMLSHSRMSHVRDIRAAKITAGVPSVIGRAMIA